MDRTPVTFFADAVERHPEAVLFRSAKRRMTYAEAGALVAQGVEHFGALAIKPGDRIVCFTDETIELALLILSCGIAGVLPASISPVFSQSYVHSLCQQSRARAIFTTPTLVPLATGVGDVDVVTIQLAAAGDLSARPTAAWPHGQERSHEATVQLIREGCARQRAGDALLIQPTSGSTGPPKLVVRPNRAFTRYAEYVGREIERGLAEGTRFKLFLANALTHAFGCHMFTLALRYAAAIVVPSELDMNASLDELRTFDPDVVAATPRVLRSFMRQQASKAEPEGTHLFGPSARLLLSAGGRGDPDAMARLRGERVEAVEFYGSSEASVVAVTPCGGWKPGLAGRPVDDVELKFSSQNELLVRSPGMMIAYYGDSELTDLVRDDQGFYRTGDLGRVDADGYLQIFGRRRDVFNTPEGTNIYPERIEILLEAQPSIRQAFLVGDGKPFVTAHLVVDLPSVPDAANNLRTRGKYGHLPAEAYPEVYERIGQVLQPLNDGLELLEQIVAVVLYADAFPDDCYRAESAKVQRTRSKFLEQFAELVNLTYTELTAQSVMLLPPRERRFAARVESLLKKRGGDISRPSNRPPPIG